MLPRAIAKALAIDPASATGTIRDVAHIVILVQENRSFDQYFGTLRGVRGFGDPRAVRLPSGRSVFEQHAGDAVVTPFRPALGNLATQFLPDIDHGWSSSHDAWNGGACDRWVSAKGAASMVHYARGDIPFHCALADAFTVCDAYHASVMGPTNPNRYYLMSGSAGQGGANGGPVIDNSEGPYSWTTLPEILTRARISWKVYQDAGTGLTATGQWGQSEDAFSGNFGDNVLLNFQQYRDARPGEVLYEGARTGTRAAAGEPLFDALLGDAYNNRLPQVSWIVAPEAFSEHPSWPPAYGAWYICRLLDALTANPDVWRKTVLFLCYDEAGGFFDHVVPPYPPVSGAAGASTVYAEDEIYRSPTSLVATPLGLGVRVPMIVVSPWSRGGWVCSEVFDHTSLIRFIQRRHAAEHPELSELVKISAWRRAICGDLTSAFDFANANTHKFELPRVAAPESRDRHPDAVIVPPAGLAVLVRQEAGLRPARALPYRLQADGQITKDGAVFRLNLSNTGTAGAWFQVRSGKAEGGPWSFTIEAGKSLSWTWDLPAARTGIYDFSVYGANGFFRRFACHAYPSPAALVRVLIRCEPSGSATIALESHAAQPLTLWIRDHAIGHEVEQTLAPNERIERMYGLQDQHGWYDIAVGALGEQVPRWHFAGHVEDGGHSFSDPALGGI